MDLKAVNDGCWEDCKENRLWGWIGTAPKEDEHVEPSSCPPQGAASWLGLGVCGKSTSALHLSSCRVPTLYGLEWFPNLYPWHLPIASDSYPQPHLSFFPNPAAGSPHSHTCIILSVKSCWVMSMSPGGPLSSVSGLLMRRPAVFSQW